MSRAHLFIFGPGYSGTAIAKMALEAGFSVTATARSAAKAATLEAVGIRPFMLCETAGGTQASKPSPPPVTHILSAAAPDRTTGDDPALAHLAKWSAADSAAVVWMGYLSSTNVYGDRGGGWVDENSAPKPTLARGERRLAAEQAWQAFADKRGVPLHIFRLAGIYGPGRSAVDSVLAGRARRIIKQGQVFSRIHVDDIAGGVLAAMQSGLGSEIFNMADGSPSPPQDVIEAAARALGVAVPPDIPFESADMSAMARSFYSESKRVRADKLSDLLGYQLRYRDFAAALPGLIKQAGR